MRLEHLQHVQETTQGLEDKVSKATFKIMQRPVDDDISKDQLTLPLSIGGMELRATSELEAHAGYLSAVAVTEQAMRAGPQFYKTFSGPIAPELTQVWQAIHAEGAKSGL